jgi:hypothetical protein
MPYGALIRVIFRVRVRGGDGGRGYRNMLYKTPGRWEVDLRSGSLAYHTWYLKPQVNVSAVRYRISYYIIRQSPSFKAGPWRTWDLRRRTENWDNTS